MMKTNSQKGTSLVETMFAILVIFIVALAGAAFIFYGTTRVNMERNKRVALEMANARLEELRSSGYASIEPPDDTQAYFLEKSGTAWVIYASDPGEAVTISGINFPITTTVDFVDDPDGSGDDYLQVEVSVNYRLADPNAVVTLTTYIQSLS